jgi:hypothetical protein
VVSNALPDALRRRILSFPPQITYLRSRIPGDMVFWYSIWTVTALINQDGPVTIRECSELVPAWAYSSEWGYYLSGARSSGSKFLMGRICLSGGGLAAVLRSAFALRRDGPFGECFVEYLADLLIEIFGCHAAGLARLVDGSCGAFRCLLNDSL